MKAESALQALINSLTRPDRLVVDGEIGPETINAIAEMPSGHQEIVNTYANVILGTVPPRLIPYDRITKMVSDVAMIMRVPASYLDLVVKLENKNTRKGVFVEYEGTFKGIGQFNEATWNRVSEKDYDKYVTNDFESLKAVASLYIANRLTYFRQFPSGAYTDEVAYLYHNQGAGGAASYIRSGVVKPVLARQSQKAIEIAKIAHDQHRYA